MDAGLRTPLLDLFRRGEAPRDVRLSAASGAVAPRPLEQLALLVLLAGDADEEVRQTAEATLARLPAPRVGALLARADVPDDMRAFFAARGIAAAASSAEADTETPLVDDGESDSALGSDAAAKDSAESVTAAIAAMTVPEKVRAATKGTREMRALLIRDPNKMVSLAVLSCPKVTETEIEAFARMGSVSEDVLRTIGQTRAWIKSYNVVLALVRNAKTPLAMSLTLLSRLNESDVRRVSIDRNVPEPLRIAARKKVVVGA